MGPLRRGKPCRRQTGARTARPQHGHGELHRLLSEAAVRTGGGARTPLLAVVGSRGILSRMSSIAEIEAAIEVLPDPQVEQLARWLETLRQRRATPPPIESWLQRARGAARPGVKTQDVMALTRSEG